jgi:hypothetical protein
MTELPSFIPAHPTLTAQPSNRIRFGSIVRKAERLTDGEDVVSKSGAAEADQSALSVPPPALMLQEYWEKRNQLQEDFEKTHQKPKGNWINNFRAMCKYKYHSLRLAWDKHQLQRQLFKVLKEGARQYLPEISKKQLFGYLHSFRRVRDYFNTDDQGLITRTIISMCGPPVVKYFQVQAQEIGNTSEEQLRDKLKEAEQELTKLRKELDNSTDERTLRKLDKKKRKEIEERIPELKREIEAKAKRIENQKLQLELRDILLPMLDDVPAIPYESVKPNIDKTIEVYNRQFPDDPIMHVDEKALGSGSMAQTHLASTRSGKKRVIKVFRPEASPEYFDDFHRFSQFLMIFLLGEGHGDWAKQASDEMMSVFKEEVRVDREKIHAEHLQTRLKKEGYPVNVPQVLATSDRGFVEEYADGPNLSELSIPERAKALQTLGPMLVKSFLIFPEKYLDPQNGNLKWPAAIFDYGRMGIFTPKAHQKILQFQQTMLLRNSQPYERRGAMRESALRHLLAKPIPQDKIGRFYYDLTNQSFDETSEISRTNPFNFDGRGRRRNFKWGGIFFQMMENLPELSDAGKTIPLTDAERPIRKLDISHAREKLQALMKPYFLYADQEFSDETLLKRLKTIRPEAYQELSEGSRGSNFGGSYYGYYNGPTGSLDYAASEYIDAKQDMMRGKLEQLRQGSFSNEGSQDRTESLGSLRAEVLKKEKQFKEELAEALENEETKAHLLKIARIDQHLNVLAEDLCNTIFQGKRISPQQKKGAVDMLKNELAIEFSPYEQDDE